MHTNFKLIPSKLKMCLLIENDFNKLKCVLISAQVQSRSWGMKLKLLTLGKRV